MTAPGGAQYLPPIVTRLLGDASDLLAAFAAALAAQEAFTKSSTDMADGVKRSTRLAGRDVDDFTDLVVRKMHAGESATAVLKRRLREVGEEVTTLRKRLSVEGANQGLFADFKRANGELEKLTRLARTLAPELLNAGEKGGRGFVAGFMDAISGLQELAVPLIIGALVVSSPVIAGLIGSAVAVGIGLGFAGVGTLAAAILLPKIRSQFVAMGREAKKSLLYGITGAFDEALRSGLLMFRVYVRQWKAPLRELFDALAPQMKFLGDALGGGVTELLNAMVTAVKNIAAPGGPLETFIATIPMVFQAVGDFLVKITENGPALSRFIYDAASAIVGFLEGAGDVIGWLEGVYLWIVKLNDKFPFIGWANTVHGLMVTFGLLKDFLPKLWDSIVKGGKGVGNWFADLGKNIWNWMKSAAKAVADWVMGVVHWFAELPGKVIRFLQALPGRIVRFVSEMAHRVVYWIGYMIGTWVRMVTELPGKILGVIAYVWAWTTDKTKQALMWLADHLRALPGQIGGFFAQVWTAVTTWVAKTWESAVLWFGRTRQAIIEKIASAITSVVQFFKDLPGKAAAWWKKLREGAADFFKGARTWLAEAGKDIVRGLIDGVTGLWDWAVGKLKSFAHDLVKGFKDAIGSHSPAKAFVAEGQNSAIGYALGWTKAIRKVRDQMRGRQTLDVVMSYPTGGTPPRRPGPGDTPPGGGAQTVHADFYLDGKRFASASTPASQHRGARNGITGTGLPTTRIM